MNVLLHILQNGLAACWQSTPFIVAILLLRQIFKHSVSPKRIYRLWFFVALRLMLPFAILPSQLNWPLRIAAHLRHKRQLCLNVESRLPLFIHSEVCGALIRGWGKHKEIYINPALAKRPQELKLALTHEYAHVAAHDALALYLKLLLLCLYWYHPLVWLAAWLAGQDSEAAADQWVLEQSGLDQRKNYAELLVKEAGRGDASRMLTSGIAFSQDYQSVRRRMYRMYQNPGQQRGPALLLAFFLVLLLTADFSGDTKRSEQQIQLRPPAIKQVNLIPEPSVTSVR